MPPAAFTHYYANAIVYYFNIGVKQKFSQKYVFLHPVGYKGKKKGKWIRTIYEKS